MEGLRSGLSLSRVCHKHVRITQSEGEPHNYQNFAHTVPKFTRDAPAAKEFFLKTLTASHTMEPRVINVDKNAAYPKAFNELQAEGHLPEPCELRQVKYLNNLIEQDHRFIKHLTKPGMGFFSFETAWRTLQRFEIMNMIRKGQVLNVEKGDVRGQVTLIAALFGVVA